MLLVGGPHVDARTFLLLSLYYKNAPTDLIFNMQKAIYGAINSSMSHSECLKQYVNIKNSSSEPSIIKIKLAATTLISLKNGFENTVPPIG